MAVKEIKLKIHDESELYAPMDPDGNLISDDVIDYLSRVFLNKHRRIREDYVISIISDDPVNEEHARKAIQDEFDRQKDDIHLAETAEPQASDPDIAGRGDPCRLAVSLGKTGDRRGRDTLHYGLGLHLGSHKYCRPAASGSPEDVAEHQSSGQVGDQIPYSGRNGAG